MTLKQLAFEKCLIIHSQLLPSGLPEPLVARSGLSSGLSCSSQPCSAGLSSQGRTQLVRVRAREAISYSRGCTGAVVPMGCQAPPEHGPHPQARFPQISEAAPPSPRRDRPRHPSRFRKPAILSGTSGPLCSTLLCPCNDVGCSGALGPDQRCWTVLSEHRNSPIWWAVVMGTRSWGGRPSCPRLPGTRGFLDTGLPALMPG